MRYFLSRRIPHADAILLVESGSRSLLETVAPGAAADLGRGRRDRPGHLLRAPARGFPGRIPAFTASRDYRGREGRRKLYRELAAEPLRADGHGLLRRADHDEVEVGASRCGMPAKVFVINENGDYFWLDRGHLDLIRQIVLLRSGLAGAGAVRTLARVVSFPFTLTVSATLCNDRACPARAAQRLNA